MMIITILGATLSEKVVKLRAISFATLSGGVEIQGDAGGCFIKGNFA